MRIEDCREMVESVIGRWPSFDNGTVLHLRAEPSNEECGSSTIYLDLRLDESQFVPRELFLVSFSFSTDEYFDLRGLNTETGPVDLRIEPRDAMTGMTAVTLSSKNGPEFSFACSRVNIGGVHHHGTA